MAIKPLNSLAGFSVSENANTVIDSNGNVYANSFSSAGTSNLGPVSNVIITGGSANYVLQTDGNGNLSWTTPPSSSSISNGTSNLSIPTANGNIVAGINGNANVLTIFDSGANLIGDLQVTANITGSNIFASNANIGSIDVGNIIVSANLTAGNILANTSIFANSNVRANSHLITSNIESISGNLNITSVGIDSSINLSANGNGTIDVNNFEISNVGGPINAKDAATKEYVDNAVSAGLTIHPSVRVETPTALTGSYVVGGTSVTVTDITNQKTLTLSTSPGLAINDMVVFNNTFNGFTAGSPYFVYSIPASNQITVSASYNGPEIINLTNATGLTQVGVVNAGVGATLINSGVQAALVIDGVTLSVNDRVLVYQQANQATNGIYVVTDTGSASTNWVLTRATDSDKYQPNSTTGMSYGDYFFVSQGNAGAGESYVNNTIGVIIIGTTPITFVQFSDTKVYSAGTGLTLTDTTFSITNTAVTSGTYGSGDEVAQFTVNPQGQLTFAGNVVIQANAGNISGNTLNPNVIYSNLNSVGNLISLTVATGGNTTLGGNLIVNTGNAIFGNANNVRISGGSNGYVLTTDGAGNLRWDIGGGGGGSSIANGNSNISIAVANGNINMAVNNNSNLVRISSNGFFSNTDIYNLKSRIVQQGGNPNGVQLSSNDGKDRGLVLNYYSSGNYSAQAFMGWDESNAEITLAKEVTVTNDVINVFALANVRADNFLGNILGNITGNITAPGANTQVLFNDEGLIDGATGLTFDKTSNAVNASGAINATGTITGGNISTAGNVSATNNITGGNIDSLGFINAFSTITGGNFYSGGSIQTVGEGTFGNVQTPGSVAATGNISSGNLSATGELNVLGNVQLGSLAANLVSVDANYANFEVGLLTIGGQFPGGTYMYPNGYIQTRRIDTYTHDGANGSISTTDFTATGRANIAGLLSVVTGVSVSGNINQNNGSFTVTGAGNISSGNGNFTVSSTGAISAGGGNFNVSNVGNVQAQNANLGNLATANYFQGDGYLISNLTIPAGSAIENGNSNVIVTPNSNVIFNVAGVNNVVQLSSTTLTMNGNIVVDSITISGNLGTGGVKNTNAEINLYTADSVANAYVTIGTINNPSRLRVNDGNVQVSSLLQVTGNANVSANVNAGNLNVSTATLTGNLQSANANLGNAARANYFIGDGWLLTNITVAAGTFIENGNSNVIVEANSNINFSSQGNANVLVITGNNVTSNKRFIAGNANITTAIISTANITDLNLFNNFNADGNLFANGWANVTGLRVRDVTPGSGGGSSVFEGNASFQSSTTTTGYANAGTIYGGYIQSHGSIHANTAITSNSISAAQSLSGANISGTNLAITTANVTTLNVSNTANILTANVSGNLRSGNANLGNLVTANYFSGDGYLLTNLTIGAGSFLDNGSSNVYVDASANIRMGVAGTANLFVVSSIGANLVGNISISANANIGGNANIVGNVSVGNISGGTANFTGDANTANLYVAGTLTATGSANTGALTVSGNIITANANLGNLATANYFQGDGWLLTNLTIPAGSQIINGNSNVLVEFAGNINITSNNVPNVLQITKDGTVTTGVANTIGNVTANAYVRGTSNIIIYPSGDIKFSSNGVADRMLVSDLGANVYGVFNTIGNATVTGNANIANLGVSGVAIVAGNISGGNLNTGGRISVGGNANVGNLYTTGVITALGTITGGRIVSEGNANVDGTANVGTLVVRSGGANISGGASITNGNLNVTGNLNINGNLTYANVVDLVISDPLIFIGANNPGDVVDLGLVASYETANVSYHTGLARNYLDGYWTFYDDVVNEPTTSIDWANATYPTVKLGNLVATGTGNFIGNVSSPNFIGNVVGNITGNVIGVGTNTQVIFNQANIANGSANFTFNYTTGQVTVIGNIVGSNLIATSNITSGNANLGNLITANYGIIGGAITGQTFNLVARSTDNTIGPFAVQATASSNYSTVAFFNSSNALSGGVGYANPSTTYYPNQMYMWGSNGIAFSGNGFSATGGTKNMYINSSGIVTIPTGVAATDTTTGALVVTGGVGISGNLFTGNANLGNLVSANFITGTLTTNAQPNVTSLGTLSNLSVGGNLTVGGGTGGNLSGANNITANFFIGNGSQLTGIAGGNVSGQVANALVAGTVYTNAQPNITSVGTLSALTVGPNSSITLSGTTGYVKANSIQGTDGTNTIYMYYGNVSGAVGIYSDLTIGTSSSGNLIANSGRAVFGNIGNVTITGGSNGYVLSTDGAGNLNWVAQSGGGGGANIQILDEGNILTNSVSSINFVGPGVYAANIGNAVTVTIPGGGGNNSITTIAIDNFVGNGVQDTFTLSVFPGDINLVQINLDGVLQLHDAYILVGQNIIFDSAPANNAQIEVTVFQALNSGTGAFSTRNYTGNGVQNTFTVTSGQTSSSLLVAENGVLQVPETDYTVSGANLIFTTPPANGQAIQVREMAVAVAQSVSIASIANGTSNINIPAANGNINLSSNGNANVLVVTGTGSVTRLITRVANNGATLSGTLTPPSDTADQFNIMGVTGNITVAAPSGTPTDGQKLVLRIKDAGTSINITWNAVYRVIGTTLPTTSTANKITYVGCIYNSTDVYWDVVAATTEV